MDDESLGYMAAEAEKIAEEIIQLRRKIILDGEGYISSEDATKIACAAWAALRG